MAKSKLKSYLEVSCCGEFSQALHFFLTLMIGMILSKYPQFFEGDQDIKIITAKNSVSEHKENE
ncbi:hypothetical protein BHOIPH791_11040 [Bartonella henselae]|uniref:hypothetical protein n=1 Tax=Bartonella henselae TaxID=38323 RepID=UPI0004AC8D36|nr:hypothetical protein [Bartonella henselae]MDM9982870.1 hypothetical protein [Bartonella henselae]MDM9985307.1 hypothetical protein [Bartonella henselae]MDM9986767.1 hypothetical protein [Bartonella henselae]MDM9987238.1 hypothetical protein [Bartonella henselae]MDM9989802.1 hypothetical protein [Bartonella henselae]